MFSLKGFVYEGKVRIEKREQDGSFQIKYIT